MLVFSEKRASQNNNIIIQLWLVRYHDALYFLLCALNFVLYFISSLSSPLEDDEGHQADYNSCQDGAVDGDEFVVQMVDQLLGITISGGGGGGGVSRVWWDAL